MDSILTTEPNADHLIAARQLTIAPIETLRSGWQNEGYGLGIATNNDSNQHQYLKEVHLLGIDGPGTSKLIAYTTFNDTLTTGAS